MVMDENFGGGISDDNWMHENTASGLGVNAFSMSSDSDKNSFVRNGQLYLYPTLTSESDVGLSDNDVSLCFPALPFFCLKGCLSIRSSMERTSLSRIAQRGQHRLNRRTGIRLRR